MFILIYNCILLFKHNFLDLIESHLDTTSQLTILLYNTVLLDCRLFVSLRYYFVCADIREDEDEEEEDIAANTKDSNGRKFQLTVQHSKGHSTLETPQKSKIAKMSLLPSVLIFLIAP